jgi:hypothetical protein
MALSGGCGSAGTLCQQLVSTSTGTATASSYCSPSVGGCNPSAAPLLAFDGQSDTWWDGCCSGYPNQWLAYQFTSSQPIASYGFITEDGECPVAWTLEGSNDGSTWTTLDSQTGQTCHDGTEVQYAVSNIQSFTNYKWVFSQGVGGNANGYRIQDIRMYTLQAALS